MDGNDCALRPAAQAEPRWARDDCTNLALALTLAGTSVATKAALLPPAFSSPIESARWLVRLALVAAGDVCFACALAAMCALLARLLAARPRAANWLAPFRAVRLTSYCLAALYAVASVPMFKVLLAPFTVRLVSLAGGPGMMKSSIVNHLSPAMIAAAVGVLAAVLLAPGLLGRLSWFRRLVNPPRSVCLAGAALLAVYATASYLYIHSEWTDPKRWERRLTQNPHAVLLASCLVELGKAEPFTQPFHFDEIDESDFRRPGEGSERPDAASGVAERPRNVLLIILESTAAEYLSVYGAPYPTTPHLERLAAANGIVYENMYAQAPASWKSLVGLMASTYCRPDWRSIVGDCPDFEVPLLPEVLARHGWRNCFLHAGYWDWRGGEEFLKRRGVQTLVDARHLPSPPLNSWGTSDRAMFRSALDWIDANQGHPFFVCACTIETHHPYWPGDNPIDFGVDDEEFNRYLNALRTTDENIHWMVEELARRGLLASTLVAVTADHGESFGQHDERVHGYGVYEPSVHVPLVLIHPGLAGLARRDRAVRQHIDLPPTLLGLLGLSPPAQWQGRDLLAPAGPPRKAYFYSVADQVVLGLRDGSFKYHLHVDTGLEELFDLSSDPGERVNLAARRPELLRRYKRCVGGFVKFQREFLEQHGGRRMVATTANGRR